MNPSTSSWYCNTTVLATTYMTQVGGRVVDALSTPRTERDQEDTARKTEPFVVSLVGSRVQRSPY